MADCRGVEGLGAEGAGGESRSNYQLPITAFPITTTHDSLENCYDKKDSDLRDLNAQTLSEPEGSSNTGCL